MANATLYSQSRDVQGMVIEYGNALQFTPVNQFFTLTAGGSPTTFTVPNAGNALAYIMEINLGTLGTNGVVYVLPAATPTLALPTGTVTATTAQLVFDGIRRVVLPGQTLQIIYGSADGTPDTISVGVSYYANSANNFTGGPNG